MNTIAMMNLEKFENEVTRMFDVLKNIMTSDTEDYKDSHYPFFNSLTYEDGIFLVYLGEYLKKFCHTTESDRTEEYRLEYEFRYIHIITGLFKKTFPNLNYEVYYNEKSDLWSHYDRKSDLWSLKYTPSNHTDDEETHVSKVTIHYDMKTDLSLLEDTPDITFQIDGYNTAFIIKSLSSVFGRPLYPKSTYDRVILDMMGYLVSIMTVTLL